MQMKFYYARSIDGKRTLQFRGETLVCNNPFIFEHLVKLNNSKFTIKGKKPIDMKEYEIMELEGEIGDAKK